MTNKLFLFTVHYPFGTGEVFIENEIGFLVKEFNEVFVIPLLKDSSKKKCREVPHGVKIIGPLINCSEKDKLSLLLKGLFNKSPCYFAIKEFIKKKVWRKKKWILNWMSSTLLVRRGLASSKLRNLLKYVHKNDIFYYYWADTSANIIPILKLKYANFTVTRFHNTDIYEENKGGYLPFRNTVLPKINLAVFISTNGSNYINQKYPGILSKQIVSRLGVFDRGVSQPSDDNIFRLVSCSAINWQKRVHLIASALSLITFPVHWTHFGDGPFLQMLIDETTKLPEHIKVIFKGHVKNKDVLKYYAENPVDLFINVSQNEGVPVAIMEASSMGIPTLATNVGGVSEIVCESNGMLMDVDSTPEMIASYIVKFYNEAPRNEMRNNARIIWDQKYNASKNYAEFCNILSTENKNYHLT